MVDFFLHVYADLFLSNFSCVSISLLHKDVGVLYSTRMWGHSTRMWGFLLHKDVMSLDKDVRILYSTRMWVHSTSIWVYSTRIWGAEKRTATVVTMVNVVKMIKQNLGNMYFRFFDFKWFYYLDLLQIFLFDSIKNNSYQSSIFSCFWQQNCAKVSLVLFLLLLTSLHKSS